MRIVTPDMDGRKLFVSFKIAEVCNLTCKYCYFFFKGDDSYQSHPPYIAPETVRKVGRFLGEGARDVGIRTVEIALHGGEPLMVGKSRFRRYCETLIAEITPHAKLNLGLQTNGLLLDREWLELVSEFGIRFGISIDGPQHVNDAIRIDKRGRGTYEQTVAALKLAQQAHREGLIGDPGVLAVIIPGTSAREIYDHLVYDLGVKRFDFMLPKDSWDSHDPETTRFIEQFSLDLLNRWLEDDNPAVRIRSLTQMLAPMLSDEGLSVRTNYLADLTEAITIRSNGDVSPDDTLPAVSERYLRTGYNVATSTLQEFYEDPLWNDLRDTVFSPPDKCARCEWLGYCGGGEVVTRYSKRARFDNPTIYCERNKLLYERIQQYVSRFVDRRVLAARAQRSREVVFGVRPGKLAGPTVGAAAV